MKILVLLMMLFISNISYGHGNHPYSIVSGNYKLKNGKDYHLSMKIFFPDDKAKSKADIQVEGIKGFIKDALSTACYDVETERGFNLLRGDLFYFLGKANIDVEDFIIGKTPSF